MKQTISRALIGFVFVLGIIFILTNKVDALVAPMNTPNDGGGAGAGGSGTTTPSMQVNLTADLDKSTYNPGDQMTVISSANWTVSGGGNTNVTITGGIVGSTSSPTTILYLNTNSGNILYGSAVFTAPSVAGDYILRVDASVPGANGREALTKMSTKDIPFTVTNNGATVEVWSIPSNGVKNDPVDVGSKTTIHWLASGLGQGASCSSPQNPNVILNYPSGSFDTGVINSSTNYTVTCKDKDGISTTNTITPATQFAAKQGAEAVSVSPTPDLGNGDQICDPGGTWCHLPFQTQTDFKNVRQIATIILGSNNIKIETLNGFPHDVISAKKDDVPGKVWTVKEDGNYKIDISANGKMTVTINNRGGFIAAVNFYLIINGVKYPISANYGGDACSSTFKYPVQYSITNLKNCDPTIQDQHTSFGKEVPLDFNFTKTVALKAGDTVEIKGLVTGWGFNSSILRDLWQSISFYLNTNYTNFTITKEAVTTVTTAGAAPANQISGTTTVTVKGIVAGMADLVASGPTPTSAVIGAEINFASVIKNQGTASTSVSRGAINFYNIFQLATKPNGGGTIEIFPSRRPIPALDAGETGITQAQPIVVGELGTHSVRACADQNTDGVTLIADNHSTTDRVDESDENNNCSAWVDVTVSIDGVDSCGPSSGTTPQLTEPIGTDACAVGTLNSSFPADTPLAWNWSCGTVKTCSAPKSGITVPTGTISATDCKIAAGENKCNTTLKWNTVNPVGVSEVTTPDHITVATGNSNAIGKNYSVSHGSRNFYLYNSGKTTGELDMATANAVCASTSSWDEASQTCKSGTSTMTGTITTGDCLIMLGKDTCTIHYNWAVLNPEVVGGTKINLEFGPSDSMTLYNEDSGVTGASYTYGLYHGQATFVLTNNNKTVASKTVKSECDPATSIWSDAVSKCVINPGDKCPDGSVKPASGICPPPSGATGTLTISPNHCDIAEGRGACPVVGATWKTNKATDPKLVDSNVNTVLSTLANNATALKVWVAYPQTVFNLKDGETILDTETVTASCVSGTEWDPYGNDCVKIPTFSVTLKATPAGPLIAPGATDLSWTATGLPDSCDASGIQWSGIGISNGEPVTHRSGMSAGTYVFGIVCHKAGLADVTSSVTVVVNPVICTNGATNPPLCNDNCSAPTAQNVTVACDVINGVMAISGSVTRSQAKSAFPSCLFPRLPITSDNSKYETDDCVYPPGSCSNGATNYPTCSTGPGGSCLNGATNPPVCDNGGGGGGSGEGYWSGCDWSTCDPVTNTQICTEKCILPNADSKPCEGGVDGVWTSQPQTCSDGGGGGDGTLLGITFDASSLKIFKGRSSVLTWDSNANKCVATKGDGFTTGDKSKNLTPGVTVSPLKTTDYEISCTRGAITETKSLTIQVDTIVIKET